MQHDEGTDDIHDPAALRSVNAELRREVADLTRAQRLLNGQTRVMELIAEGVALSQSLSALVRLVEQQVPGMLGSILLLDDEGLHLKHGAAPSLPDDYAAAIDGAPIGPRAGSCGTAAFRRSEVIVEDIEADPLWQDYREVARPYGLRACWSTPIFDEQHRVLGTFAMYYRQPEAPRPFHLDLIGMVTHIAAIAITHNRAQAALRQSEARLAEAQRIAHIGHWELDLTSQALVWSDEIFRLFEIDSQRFGASYDAFLEAIHPDDRDMVNRAYTESVEQREPYDIVHRLLMPDGRVKWVNERCETFYDGDRPVRSIGTVIDISELHRAQEELRESQAYNRGLIEASLDGLLTVDQELVITDVNESLCQLTGRPRTELVGSRFPDHFIDPDRAAEGVRRTLRNGSVTDYELVLAHRNGADQEILVSFNAATYADATTNAIKGIFASARDITARRAAEDQVLRLNIQRRDDALEASRLKSEFLATMSHEIRTPMTGVIGLTNLLLNTGLDKTQRRYARGAEAAGKALLAIISDVLDISKIEAGKIVLSPREFRLLDLVEELVDLVGEPAEAKNIAVGSYYSSALPDVVVGDPLRVRQILLNLIDNAVKFTEHGGVSVLVTPAEPTQSGSSSIDVRIEVIDTGIGISTADIERLFARFEQATPTPNRPSGGTGLGLAISRQLVELMGGELGVDSDVGAGSTFWCTISFGKAATASPAIAPEVSGGRVLLVEPNSVTRSIVDHYLTDWGMEVLTASSIEEATNLAVPWDLAIVEHQLTDGDGVELAHQLDGVPVVLLTDPTETSLPPVDNIRTLLNRPVHRVALQQSLDSMRTGVPPADQDDRHIEPSAVTPTRGRVLVVEDNEINQMVAAGMLAQVGCAVEVVGDGEQCVRSATAEPYDLILMDVIMPVLDGYAATQQLRDLEGDRRHTPVVAMTASAQPADRDRCLAAGMDDYIAKPFTLADLTTVLDRWLPAGRRPR